MCVSEHQHLFLVLSLLCPSSLLSPMRESTTGFDPERDWASGHLITAMEGWMGCIGGAGFRERRQPRVVRGGLSLPLWRERDREG